MTMSAAVPSTGAAGERGRRLTSLDGLRGIAAFVVVAHHAALVFPAIAATYVNPDSTRLRPGTMAWWLTATPFKLMTAGQEAVLVFFVISGVALALPVIRNREFDWWSYYPRRVARLWLPAVGSILLASAWIIASNQSVVTGQSPWVVEHSYARLLTSQVVGAMDLLFGDIRMNNPLWSLRWEVVFSLLLPLFLGLSMILRKYRLERIGILGALFATFVGVVLAAPFLKYLPPFLIGTVMAVSGTDKSPADRESRRSTAYWTIYICGSLLLGISYWLVRNAYPTNSWLLFVCSALATVGAAGLVWASLNSQGLARLLSTRMCLWAGWLSFSLYLVHAPIIIAFAYWCGPTHRFTAIAIAVPMSIAVAHLFAQFIEQPAHRLAGFVGRTVSAAWMAHREISEGRP